ncbi:MAG: rane protein [Pseudonocardiales bacterium]|nr:integral rane protein [Jatrophihabitans sp.]MDT4903732.1 rane protein [Pseudonocardiales bacterium]
MAPSWPGFASDERGAQLGTLCEYVHKPSGAGQNGSVSMSPRRRVAASRAWWAQSLGGSGWRRIRELDLDTHALAFCAQQVLCTAPLIVAMSAVMQRETGNGGGYILTRFFGLRGQSAQAVNRLFGNSAPSISTFALVLAFVTALIFSTSVGAVQQRAFEMIWTLPRANGFRSYLRQLGWAVVLGIYSIAMLMVGRVGRSFEGYAERPFAVLAAITQGALTFAFYWWSQRWLLGRRLTWRALLPGAICVGIGTAILFRLTRVIMPGQISWQVHAYGVIGAVFVLSVWLMILSGVIFGGILLGALITERRADAEKMEAGDTDESPLTLEGLQSAESRSEELPAAPPPQEFSST